MERDSIRVTPTLVIPRDEFELRFSRSSGPGGQHAQRSETRVEAVFDVAASRTLTAAQKERIEERLGAVARAVAQDERSQLRNRELALERLAEQLRRALRPRLDRRATSASGEAREQRLTEKRRRAELKRLRRPPRE